MKPIKKLVINWYCGDGGLTGACTLEFQFAELTPPSFLDALKFIVVSRADTGLPNLSNVILAVKCGHVFNYVCNCVGKKQ